MLKLYDDAEVLLFIILFLDFFTHQQLKKESRKNKHEMHKILAANQRLKTVSICFLKIKML